MRKRKTIAILAVFALIFTLLGGTLAYWNWDVNEEEKTEITVKFKQNFSCAIDGGGNITNTDAFIAPASCTNSTYAIQREVKVMPTISGNSSVLMDLWIDINDIGEELSDSANFKYALTTEADSCTEGVIRTGSFNGRTEGDTLPLFSYKTYDETTTDTYYLYIWLDSKETSQTTMNQIFDLSLNGDCTDGLKGEAYAVYSADDSSLRFYRSATPIETGSEYNGKTATAVYTGFENRSYNSDETPWYGYRENITKVVVEDMISSTNTSYWFYDFKNCTYMDLTKLDTSNVASMIFMFNNTGYNATSFKIIGLDSWNLSNVTNMIQMFYNVGYSATDWSIGNISSWDTSKVTNMAEMFYNAGYNAINFNTGDLSYWNTSNVTNMSYMFNYAGYNATTWNVGTLFNWDTSKVTSMANMFNYAGRKATVFNLNLSSWNVSNVANMSYMFNYAGRYSTKWNIGDISGWNTSNVTNMSHMLFHAGQATTNWSLNLSGWNVLKVMDHTNFSDVSRVTQPSWVS